MNSNPVRSQVVDLRSSTLYTQGADHAWKGLSHYLTGAKWLTSRSHLFIFFKKRWMNLGIWQFLVRRILNFFFFSSICSCWNAGFINWFQCNFKFQILTNPVVEQPNCNWNYINPIFHQQIPLFPLSLSLSL